MFCCVDFYFHRNNFRKFTSECNGQSYYVFASALIAITLVLAIAMGGIHNQPSSGYSSLGVPSEEGVQYSFSSIPLPSTWAAVTSVTASPNLIFLGGSDVNDNALFGYYTPNGEVTDVSLPSDLTQIHALSYGGGYVLAGGQDNSGASLVAYQISTGSFIDLTQSLRSQVSASLDVNAIAYDGNEFLIGGATNWFSLIGFYSPGSNVFQSLQSNVSEYFASNAIVWDGQNFLMAGAGAGPGGSPGTPPKLGYASPSGMFQDVSDILPSDVGVMWRAAFDGAQFLIGAQDSHTGNLVLYLFNPSTESFTNVTMNFPSGFNVSPLTIANNSNEFIVGGSIGGSGYLSVMDDSGSVTDVSQFLPPGVSSIQSISARNNQIWIGGSYSSNRGFFGVSGVETAAQSTINLIPYYGNVANLPLVGTGSNPYVYTNVGFLTMSPDLWKISKSSIGSITMSAGQAVDGDVTAQIQFSDVADRGINPSQVTGYPSLSYGMAINGATVSTDSNLLELPIKMNKFSSLQLTTSYSVNPHKVSMDFSYDIWITHDITSKMSSKDVELMLWLYDANGMTPWWVFQKGQYTTPGIVNGISTTIKWTAYQPWFGGTSAQLLIFAIDSVGTKADLKQASVSINLMDIWPHAESILGTLSSTPLSRYYLEAIYLGSEFIPTDLWYSWLGWFHLYPTAYYSWRIFLYNIEVTYA